MELHIIFGPTATSKTKIAQALWEQYHYPLLSVDSRKVYKGADIGTNKLAILTFQKEHPQVLFGGIDFLEPHEEVSAFVYQQYIFNWLQEHETEILAAGGLIIHGGTGLYLDAILEGKSLLSPKNVALRESLLALSLEELQKKAEQDNSRVYNSLNESDRKNARRLIRVIENKDVHTDVQSNNSVETILSTATKIWHVDLPPRAELYEIINGRVLTYFSQGWAEEIVSLLKKYSADSPALKMMGYRQVVDFMMKNDNWEELIEDSLPPFTSVVEEIQREHRRYAKRQETWAKKYLEKME